MVKSCSAINCTKRFKKGENIKFHKFPKDKVLRKKWLVAVRRQNFVPTDTSLICSKHFVEEDYFINVHGNKQLKVGSVPSEFDFPGKTKKKTPRRILLRQGNKEAELELRPLTSLAVSSEPNVSTTSDLTESTLGLNAREPKKRKRQDPIYMGDFDENDLKNPMKCHQYWEISQATNRRQKNTIKMLRIKTTRYRNRISSLNSLIDDLNQRNKLTAQCSLILKDSIPEAEKQLIFRQIKEGRGLFPPALRSFALTLNFYSSSAYNYVRNLFGKKCLPHPRTLTKWYGSIDGSPGYTVEAIRAIIVKAKTEEEKGESLKIGLIMDEMAIKEYVEWNGKRHLGYINYGTNLQENDNLPRAKNALVFMAVGLNTRWKVPIAYFLVDSLTAEEKATLVRGCLLQLEHTGTKVVSLTFDGCPSNISMCNLLGADLTWPNIKPYFSNPSTGEKIQIILDPCHMIKLIRNALGDWQYIYDKDNSLIQWQYFIRLVGLQEEAGLHAATKIRSRHLNYEREKMKVKLAVEVFSSSVADAIDYLGQVLNHPEFSGCESTVKFCRKINNIFDVLNSRNFLGKVVYKRPVSLDNQLFIKKFINESIEFISNLKDRNGNLIVQSGRKTGFLGLIISLMSVQNLIDDLIVTEKLKFLFTYKLSQDHLEMFFSAIRAQGGFNNNPTARQFEGAYKRLLIHTEIKSSGEANCLAQDQTSILHVSSSIENSSNSVDSLTDSTYILNSSEENDLYQSSILSHIQNNEYLYDVIGYIAGFIVKKINKSLNCEICAQSLLCEVSLSSLLKNKNRGGLCKPSEDVIKICLVAESIIRASDNISRSNVSVFIMHVLRRLNLGNVFNKMSDHFKNQDPLQNHLLQLVKLIVKIYFTIRVHHINKTNNEVSNRIRHKFTKLIHFRRQ